MATSLIVTPACSKQDPNNNLYTSDEFDFSVQLPVGYKLLEDDPIVSNTGFDNVFMFYPKSFINNLVKPRIDISIFENAQLELIGGKGSLIISEEDLEINGYKAKKYVSDILLESTQSTECTTYRIANNEFIYSFSQRPCKNTKLLEDVVMTFNYEE